MAMPFSPSCRAAGAGNTEYGHDGLGSGQTLHQNRVGFDLGNQSSQRATLTFLHVGYEFLLVAGQVVAGACDHVLVHVFGARFPAVAW